MKKVVVTFELTDYWYGLCIRALNRADNSFVYRVLISNLLRRSKINFDGHEVSE